MPQTDGAHAGRAAGQRSFGGIGLYDYGARFYDPLLGRFISPDSVVPGAGNPQALNRYSYVRNMPLKRVDPTGHNDQCPDNWCNVSPISTYEQDPYTTDYKGLRAWYDAHPDYRPWHDPYLSDANPVANLEVRNSWNGWAFDEGIGSAADRSDGVFFMAAAVGGVAGSDSDGGGAGGANVERVSAKDVKFSQKGVSWATREDGIPLDDLSQSIATGWKGDPLRVVEKDGQLVSLDNRRLAAARLIDIDVPIERVSLSDPAINATWRSRDGVFDRVRVHGTDLWVE